MRIDNLTLAHFSYFSSLFTNLPLHLSRILYKSTLFMQNKPNSLNVQIYINIYYTKDYTNFIPLAGQKNKPNSNPIQTQSNPIAERPKMNESLFATKDYENISNWTLGENKPKQTQFQGIL
jgi:hypothetical protein